MMFCSFYTVRNGKAQSRLSRHQTKTSSGQQLTLTMRRNYSPLLRPGRLATYNLFMAAKPEPLEPILTAHLFPKLEAMLIELLGSLSPNDWEKQTLAPKWKVKDVAAHLLDTQLRKLSLARDGYVAERPDLSKDDGLVDFINRLNAGGVGIYRRLSPQVLIELMRLASKQSIEYHHSLDPHADA